VDRPVAAFAVTPVCIYRRRRYFTISLGHRPRNLIARKQALKARFTFGQVQKLDESRFQRLAFGPSMNLRCCPRLEIECCVFGDKNIRHQQACATRALLFFENFVAPFP
jgi:hypothetical protein